MIAVVQLVNHASISVFGSRKGNKIGPGILVFLGIKVGDTEKIADLIIRKILRLRIFPDKDKKMDLDITSVNGEILLIPQFTLLGRLKGNNRPDFTRAAKPDIARLLYEYVSDKLSRSVPVKTGFFAENMQIKPLLSGPVTIILDSENL